MRALVAGDWNAPPTDPHRHRPRWIARKAGLAIRSAGPGTHGNIDYPMTDAELAGVRRLDRLGSDHQPVVWSASHRGRTLTMGTWNVGPDRDPAELAGRVRHLMRKLGVLCLQECSPGAAAAMRAAGLRVYGHGQQRVVVGPGVGVTAPRHHRLSSLGWPLDRAGTRRGPWHAPATATSITVGGWLWVCSVHLPNHERSRWHALAYAQAARRLVRKARRH
jgi:hypothetical protein